MEFGEQSLPPSPIRKRKLDIALNAGFDQICKGDVRIKKLSKYKYQITFSKVYNDRFLFYQVFNKDNKNNINDKRFVAYISANLGVNAFINTNIISKEIPFTPTAIMEFQNCDRYAFVIHDISMNTNDKIVFIASTKEIKIQNDTHKKLIKIPSGKFKHVRFDIDDNSQGEPGLRDSCKRNVCTYYQRLGLSCPDGCNDTTISGDLRKKTGDNTYENSTCFTNILASFGVKCVDGKAVYTQNNSVFKSVTDALTVVNAVITNCWDPNGNCSFAFPSAFTLGNKLCG